MMAVGSGCSPWGLRVALSNYLKLPDTNIKRAFRVCLQRSMTKVLAK